MKKEGGVFPHAEWIGVVITKKNLGGGGLGKNKGPEKLPLDTPKMA